MPEYLREGLHKGVPMEFYVGDPCVEPSASKGALHRIITQSPAHARYWHPRLNPNCPKDDSSRADLGSAIHAAILGGADLVYLPEDFKDWRKKEAQAFRDDARAVGKIPLLEHQRMDIQSAKASAVELLRTLPGWTDKCMDDTEGTMIWRDGKVWKRGRYDIWAEPINTMIDVKTTANADPSSWLRSSLLGGGYDLQSEHYLDGLAANGAADDGTTFMFLLVEIEPPFCCSFVGLGPEYSDFAKRKLAKATEMWAQCMESGKWPGYSTVPHWAELRGFEEVQFADKNASTEGA